MKRRSFIGWLAAALASFIIPATAAASIPRPKTGRWEELANEDSGWIYQLIWNWEFGHTNMWPLNIDRTRWIIRIMGSPREEGVHHFNGTEEAAKAEAERYTREKLANI